jgi:hypothetical protein
MRSLTTSNITDNRDLEEAVHSATGQISTVLMQDLFGTKLDKNIIDGTGGNEPYDSSNVDPWLADLEPDATTFQWHYVTDLLNTSSTATPKNLVSAIIPEYQNGVAAGAAADADGDGVADSMWIKLPNLSTSKGKPVFAAVRIIDNCAMLNLNTAFGFYQPAGSLWQSVSWSIGTMGANFLYPRNQKNGADMGRYLSEVNFGPFLRGHDRNRAERIQLARDAIARANSTLPPANPDFCNYGVDPASPNDYPRDYHNLCIMSTEKPGKNFSLFDIGDELEIRNRYLITSKVIARFEKADESETTTTNPDADLYPPYFSGFNPAGRSYTGVAFQTFDFGRGEFVGGWNVDLRSKSIPCEDSDDLDKWRIRLNPANFDGTGTPPPLYPYYYDRRHVCTFYSFDRNIRNGKYPLIDAVLQSPALQSLSAAQRQTVEGFFRPINNRPIDLRTITDPTKRDPVTNNLISITANTPEARKNILHLLYAFREYYLPSNINTLPAALKQIEIRKAALKSAQIVANMIDYLDDDIAATQGPFYKGTFTAADGTTQLNYLSQRNPNPTFITRSIIRDMIREACIDYNVKNPTTPITVIDIGQTASAANPYEFGLGLNDTATPPFETVYGYERQPFISEVYCDYTPTGAQGFALELLNPYAAQIDLNGWNIRIGTTSYPLAPANAYVVPGGTSTAPGRLVIYDGTVPGIVAGWKQIAGFGLGVVLTTGGVLELQRPDPANALQFIMVDGIDNIQRTFLVTDPGPGNSINVSSRDDTAWKFTNKTAYVNNNTATLGSANGVTATPKGYQLPLDNANTPIERLADFQRIAFIGNEGGTVPQSITDQIATAAAGTQGESGIRFDPDPTKDAGLLGYICTLNRSQGNLPGRININTAPKYVIAAAIPPNLVMSSATDPNNALYIAEQIIAHRPYTNLGDLLKIPAMKKFANDNPTIVGDVNINGDFEKQDWIFNRLSNIFTVRSDTFTAYILVRLGTDGPQRRMMAIFDRSNVWSAGDKPKLVALHPVPDPR